MMPTPSEEATFLPAILGRPHDDGPRLIYADFLDESDSSSDRARAELIRLQCALSRLPRDHARREELVGLEAELLHKFLPRWTDHLRDLTLGVEFRRGIPDSVVVDTAAFLARGEELLRRAPVQRVRFHDASRSISRLAVCPLLASIRELDFSGNDLGNGGVNVLLRSPYLGALEHLDLSFNSLCDGGMRLLAKCGAMPNLHELELTDNGQISSDGLKALAESPFFTALRVLDISGNDVSDAGVRAVAESRMLSKLHTFRVFANHIGDAGVAALAESPLLDRMLAHESRLDLRHNAITAVGSQALAASPRAAKLTQLDLSGNYLEDAGLTALANSEHLPRLRTLRVRQNQITDTGATALANSPLMPRLRTLDLSANRITRTGADALWQHRRDWRTEVELSDNLVPNPPRSRGSPDPNEFLQGSITFALGQFLDADNGD